MKVSKEHIRQLNAVLYPTHTFTAPTYIVLGVNNICNLHCKMCDVGMDYNESNFYNNLMGSHPLNMPLELIKKIIDDTALYFPKSKIGYAFTEPLIYPHLTESLGYAASKNMYTSVTTNALNLKIKAKEIAAAGLNEINISLDGPAEIHNEIRGHKNSFQRAIEGIETLLAQPKRPKISIYCVITEWNVGHLKAFLDNFKNVPIHTIGFTHTCYTTDSMALLYNQVYGQYYATASNVSDTNIAATNINALHKEIELIKADSYPFKVVFSPEINNKEDLQKFYQQPETKFGSTCFDVYRTLMIKTDGTAIPAHGRCYNVTVGNIYEQSIKEVWNGKPLTDLRLNLKKAGGLFPACTRCCSAFQKPFWKK